MIKKLFLIIAVIILFSTGCEKEDATNLYTIKTEVFSQDEIRIQYPKIYGMGDSSKEDVINSLIIDDLLETEVLGSIRGYLNSTTEDITSLNLSYKVMLQTTATLSVLFTGESSYYTGRPDVKSSYRISDVVYAITIDLDSAEKLKLSNVVVIDKEFVDKIKQSPDVNSVSFDEGFSDKQILIQEMQAQDTDRVIKELEGEGIFCLTSDSLIVCIRIFHAIGDYVLARIPYE